MSTLDQIQDLLSFVHPHASAQATTSSMSQDSDRLYPYDYRELHNDLEKGVKTGSYGWDHAMYHAIAEKKAGVDLASFHSKRSRDEYYIPQLKSLLDNPKTQKQWRRIATFDPFGMTANVPTIAGTTATLNIPELPDLTRDGVIVDKDGGINIIKAGIYHAWNLPVLSGRLGLQEKEMREALHKYTNNRDLLNPKFRAFLPPVGGQTVYFFGDPSKLCDKKTEIAVRVHDECNGSDVFGTDICTCRPYLIFAIRACVECAQRGGVGVISYFRKEGRSLGEVTKFRVYNARKNQAGGDRPDQYFFHTESIAGIRDARFQAMMPDVLNWLGIESIDWLLSMSDEKYSAIRNAGIRVNQRLPLPNIYVPKNAFVELTAKIMSGYHTDDMQGGEKVIDEMRELATIRKQCYRMLELAKANKLYYFTVNLKAVDTCADAVVDCINRHYPKLNVPMHSRFRHLNITPALSLLKEKWATQHISKLEQTRRLIDLTTVSVLLDAGAGANWHYIDRNGDRYERSEGLAVASLDMFLSGFFSSDVAVKTRVNSAGLQKLTTHQLQVGFQVSANNPMVGLKGRCGILQRLGKSMEEYPEYFGYEVFRPGHLLDYVLRHADDKNRVSLRVLWRALIYGLENIWPQRTSGIRYGDVWTHNVLKIEGKPGSDMIPFHKLQQWLCFSLLEAMMDYGIEFTDLEQMTALAEYRNGGLLIDTGVLEMKPEVDIERGYDVGSELIVEWRALTVPLLDMIADAVRKRLNKTEKEFPLACVLEGGTWQTGREFAKKLREGGTPPIHIRSDGTVF